MDATTLRVREPRELLALLPYQLGFQPRSSAVAVALRPPRGRVGLVARVDLADLADDDLGPQLARRLVTHIVGDGATRAVLVLYTDCDPRPPGVVTTAANGSAATAAPSAELSGHRVTAARPSAAVTRDAASHFRDAAAGFLGDVAVWAVGPDGYLALDCTDLSCCPAGGRPLRELESTQVGAHMVLAGAMVADSRESLVPDVPAPAAARRNARRAAERRRARRSAAEAAGPRALHAWRADGLLLWRSTLRAAAWGEPVAGPAVLGRVWAALDDVVVRDAVLLTLVPGTGDLPERSLAQQEPGRLGAEVARALGKVVSPGSGVPPDDDLHLAATRVLERVVAHTAGTDRGPATTLLGLLAWWRGDGARASVLLERALTDDPENRLALLLAEALTAGLAPGWARPAT